MTADEARELTTGSMKHKGPWYKMKLTWICGRINKDIENVAEVGKKEVLIELGASEIKKYYPLIRHMYENLGYSVSEPSEKAFYISWDERLSATYPCPNCNKPAKLRYFIKYSYDTTPTYELKCECGRHEYAWELNCILTDWKKEKHGGKK